ncbi:hypothetical protein L2E82_11839 [Cichorium intybus]|uniref:Uncharacterized protein n=1 Tax=Cichorium intybus TaxID=13427 RepID=A0ACB9GF50_CICIN|nr:hypothetical protein L2E82_11839 [Cichorium intybus]
MSTNPSSSNQIEYRYQSAFVLSRAEQQSSLSVATSGNPLDILVIGGGATGSGVALDAATRGLHVGIVEREDFSSAIPTSLSFDPKTIFHLSVRRDSIS